MQSYEVCAVGVKVDGSRVPLDVRRDDNSGSEDDYELCGKHNLNRVRPNILRVRASSWHTALHRALEVFEQCIKREQVERIELTVCCRRFKRTLNAGE